MYPLIIIFSLQIAIAQKAPNDYVTEIVDVQFKKLGATEIEGAITFKNGYVDETTVYFRSRFNKAFKSVDGWQSAAYTGETTNYGVGFRREFELTEDVASFTGKAKSGVIIHFETAEGEQITTSTGLSFVSSENAALNLETELGPLDYDFDKVVAQSKKEWNALLGSVEVKGKDSRMAANDFFSTSPYTAWLGEEDEGQMGALYNLLSIGLFEMKAGCSVAPYYDLSSPVFDVITIHLDQKYYPGEKFTIKVANNSPENDFIQSAELNGKKLQEPKILHKDIVEGGELTIDLGVAPN